MYNFWKYYNGSWVQNQLSLKTRCVSASSGNVIVVGDGGAVFQSINYGDSFFSVTPPTSDNLLYCAITGYFMMVALTNGVYVKIGGGGWAFVAQAGITDISASENVAVSSNFGSGEVKISNGSPWSTWISTQEKPPIPPEKIAIEGSVIVCAGKISDSVAISVDFGASWELIKVNFAGAIQQGKPVIRNGIIILTLGGGASYAGGYTLSNGERAQALISNDYGKSWAAFNGAPPSDTTQYTTSAAIGDNSVFVNVNKAGVISSHSLLVTKIGDEVVDQASHKKYKSTIKYNFDNKGVGASKIPPTWIEVGSSNKYAMFDQSTNQKSFFGTSTKSVTLNNVGLSNTLGLFAISGINSATITVKNQGGTTLYTETKSTDDPSGAFADLKLTDLLFEYPPFDDTDITISFTGTDMEVGGIATGLAEQIGTAVAGTSLGDTDYSTLEYDEFGNVKYIERPIVPYHNFQTDVEKRFSIAVARKIQSVRGINAVWIADIGEPEKLVALGRCERSPITYDNPSLVSYSIKVKGSV